MSSNLTISLWAKILDDSQGVLVRSGQFNLWYHDDNAIRASVYTGSSWKEVETESLSGRWTHYAFTYDGVELKFYSNGILQDSMPVTGYMKWGDGSDHNLYLGSYGTSGWNAKAEMDDFRVYRRAFSEGEVSRGYEIGREAKYELVLLHADASSTVRTALSNVLTTSAMPAFTQMAEAEQRANDAAQQATDQSAARACQDKTVIIMYR